jgi:tRNA/tmRNA/rRNA uracil-C5-methylase (TrmA/RlmC/RlmD family)
MIVAGQAQKVYSVEIVASASEDNVRNLEKNTIKNVEVINAPVEDFLKEWKNKSYSHPPRRNSHRIEFDINSQKKNTIQL